MDMLAVICFSLLIGVAITKLSVEKSTLMKSFLESVNDLMIVIIGWAMKLAPFGVFSLIFSITARFGYELLQTLGWYVAVVLVGLAIQMFLVMPILLITLAPA
jgi:DAACS family dicarboxylate/amino acid:cation (Na+ or H+) symporter